MTPITALDMAGITSRRIDAWTFSHACPWCGAEAYSDGFGMQCLNPACHIQAASALDILTLAAPVKNTDSAIQAAQEGGLARAAIGRRVMDWWVAECRKGLTAQEASLTSSMARNSMSMPRGFAFVPMGRSRLTALKQLAEDTFAELPASWAGELPAAAVVRAVQSVPHTIDRMIVSYGNKEVDIIWKANRTGFTGLLGAHPGRGVVMAASVDAAYRLHYILKARGRSEHVGCIYYDADADAEKSPWHPGSGGLLLAPANPDDVILMQSVVDAHHDLESRARGIHISGLPDAHYADGVPWSRLRQGFIHYLSSGCATVPPEAARLFERTGSRREDSMALTSRFRAEGRARLADDIVTLTRNRVVYRERKTTVRETANSYRVESGDNSYEIASFVLRLDGTVLFRDRWHVFYSGELSHGKDTSRALVSSSALEDPKKLQGELQSCIIASGKAAADMALPVVADNSAMRKYVMPCLRRDTLALPMIEGVSRVGWSVDRSIFHMPGMTLGMNGAVVTPGIFHPMVPTLRVFSSVDEWSSACPPDLPAACRDAVAIILALTVRYYRRCARRPACIEQSAGAFMLFSSIAKALGQHSVFELGSNVRGTDSVDGINGYPFLASGFGRHQLSEASVPYIILTDTGYQVDDDISQEQADRCGRAAQFALVRTVEWCMATNATEFKEVASSDLISSLLLEGKWLIETACDLQPWEVRVRAASEFDRILSQIPLGESASRMLLDENVALNIDLRGLDVDVEKTLRELSAMGAEPTFADGSLKMGAVVAMPAISKFYGRRPDYRVTI